MIIINHFYYLYVYGFMEPKKWGSAGFGEKFSALRAQGRKVMTDAAALALYRRALAVVGDHQTVDALALDRLMPMLHNALTEGRAWQANGVIADKVRRRAESISRGSPALGALARELIESSVTAGHLADPESGP